MLPVTRELAVSLIHPQELVMPAMHALCSLRFCRAVLSCSLASMNAAHAHNTPYSLARFMGLQIAQELVGGILHTIIHQDKISRLPSNGLHLAALNQVLPDGMVNVTLCSDSKTRLVVT